MTTLQALLDEYNSITGQELPYATCERRLYEFTKLGFGLEDLRLVLNYVMAVNRKQHYQYSLRFGRIIGEPEAFGDLLGLAKQRQRECKVHHALMSPAKRDILSATGRDASPEGKVPWRGLDEVFESIRKETNGGRQ